MQDRLFGLARLHHLTLDLGQVLIYCWKKQKQTHTLRGVENVMFSFFSLSLFVCEDTLFFIKALKLYTTLQRVDLLGLSVQR